MSKDNIRLSEKHGLNPSLIKCPFCGKHSGIALMGRLKNDAEAPKEIMGESCDDCMKDAEEKGFILIYGINKKYKTPIGFAFLNKEAINPELLKDNPKMLYADKDVFESITNAINEHK